MNIPKLLVLCACAMMILSLTNAHAEKNAIQSSGAQRVQVKEKFDTNKDGKLDKSERTAMKSAWKNRKGKRHAKMLEKFDADKDGKLSDSEKAEARKAFKIRHAEKVAKYDANKDGKLDDTERAAARADRQKNKQ